MNNFQQAMKFVIEREGGYVNDPKDPGGETNYGISKRSYPDLDIKNLSLGDAMAIYKRDYWDAYKLDTVTSPLCIVMMDGYVQHRPATFKRMIERAKGDWKTLIQERVQFYLLLIQKNPNMGRFKRGWLNRMNQLDKYCTIALQSND